MTEQKQLSLCVITKNEEAYLPGCLENMKEAADEMLVADLGSSDRTCELAKQAGAAVYRPKWEDDFSEIRNFCLNHTSGEWVLFLQADEMIPREQQKELKLLLQNPNAEGYLITMDGNREERAVSSPAQSLRLLRNRKNYRFRYRSFEYIPDEELYSIQRSGLRMTRRGEKAVGWQQKERTRLLQTDMEENPKDGYVQYLYGIHLLNQGKYRESAASFELSRRSFPGGYLYVPHLYRCLSICCLAQGEEREAEEVLTEGLLLFPYYTDLLVLRARLYHRLGRDGEAMNDIQTGILLAESPNVFVPEPETDRSAMVKMQEEIRAGLSSRREK